MRRAGRRPRERHSRLTLPRRRVGPALRSRSPRRAVRPAPGLRAADCLLAVALVLPGALLLSAGAAQAQTTVKLVSTIGQTETATATTTRFINDRAQAFTTGSHRSGYTLKRVDLPMSFNGISNPVPPTYTVKIHSAVLINPGSPATPGSTVLGTLTNPASVIEGINSHILVQDDSAAPIRRPRGTLMERCNAAPRTSQLPITPTGRLEAPPFDLEISASNSVCFKPMDLGVRY